MPIRNSLQPKSGSLPTAVYFGSIRPLRITSRQASMALGAAKRSRTLQRLIHAALTDAKKEDGSPWLVIAQRGGGGRPTLIDTASFEAAYQAMLRGENPPPLPSEAKNDSPSRNQPKNRA
jgi:hypothetical protein